MSTAEAVESLTELGLTEYEARCFVALTRLSDGTAKEISQVADVPQSRVYDVADRLHERGLVDVQESDPRRYFALPVEQAAERIRREYDASLEAATRELEALETRATDTDAVWEIARREDVSVRTRMHVADAEEEVYLALGGAASLGGDVLEALSSVADAGVEVYVEAPSEATEERVHDAVPEARVAVTDLSALPDDDASRTPGRLLSVDGRTILLTACTQGLVPDEVEETGLWGRGRGYGLVAWLRPLLEERRERLTFRRADES